MWHLDSRLLSSLLGITFFRWAMPFSVNSTEPLPPEMPNPEVLFCCKCTWWWEPEIKTGHVKPGPQSGSSEKPSWGPRCQKKVLLPGSLSPITSPGGHTWGLDQHLMGGSTGLTVSPCLTPIPATSPYAPQTSSSVVPHLKLTRHNPWLSFFKFTGQQPGGPWCSGSLCWLWVSGTLTSEIKPT